MPREPVGEHAGQAHLPAVRRGHGQLPLVTGGKLYGRNLISGVALACGGRERTKGCSPHQHGAGKINPEFCTHCTAARQADALHCTVTRNHCEAAMRACFEAEDAGKGECGCHRGIVSSWRCRERWAWPCSGLRPTD